MPLFEAGSAPVRGWLVGIDEDGVAQVDWPGNALGPVAACSLVQIDAAPAADEPAWPVLLVFDALGGAPIVAGLLHRRIVRAAAPSPECGVAPGRSASTAVASTPPAGADRDAPLAVSLDGRTVSLQAAERIELRCGDSALVMTADGRVVIRGANLVSRASETNKIRGAAVLIN